MSYLDLAPWEQEVLRQAGINGGEILDELQKTDLKTLSLDEWNDFLNAIYTVFRWHWLEHENERKEIKEIVDKGVGE